MQLTVKTTKDKYQIDVEDSSDVKVLREKVSTVVESPIEQICLIFAGKILKDGDTLESQGLKDGLTVHLVVRSNNRPTSTNPPGSAQPSATPTGGSTATPQGLPNLFAGLNGLGGLDGLGSLGNMGAGGGSFAEMQQRMQQEMMSNPEMMTQLMNNPFIQSVMSNPEFVRTVINSNPQMRDVIERNPEINHVLNNPDILRETMRMAMNPAAFQEMMRNQDRALSNLESIPGGYNQLRRFYTDFQEPMFDAAQEQFGSNPFASLANNGRPGATTTPSTTENTEPLPNPWAANTNSSGNAGRPAAPTPPTGGLGGGNLGGGSLGDMMNQPGIQSLMAQFQQNPEMLSNLMSSPHMDTMMQSMMNNPAMMEELLQRNPMFANNPAMREQFRQQMPNLMENMRNPEIRNMMTNPQALSAMQQIQQGMSQLSMIAPNVFGNQTAAGTPSANPTTTPSTNPATTPTPDLGSLMALLQGGGGLGGLGGMGGLGGLGGMGGNTGTNVPPEERFRTQLEQLEGMGFMNREANIRALTAAFGDVNGAIERLLQ